MTMWRRPFGVTANSNTTTWPPVDWHLLFFGFAGRKCWRRRILVAADICCRERNFLPVPQRGWFTVACGNRRILSARPLGPPCRKAMMPSAFKVEARTSRQSTTLPSSDDPVPGMLG
jgi:hypothetical protein